MDVTDESSGCLRGLRILLVEDEYLVASHLKALLQAWGCEIAGPAPSLEAGHRLAQQEDLHGAILDINIVGGDSVPIADVLRSRGLPFIFITGYASPPKTSEAVDAPIRLHKPIDEEQLKATILREFVRERPLSGR